MRLSVSANREELVTLMQSADVDLAIMGRPPKEFPNRAEPFAMHPHVLVTAPDHPFTQLESVPAAALAREPFIVREPGSDTRVSMSEAFGRHMAQLNVALEVKSTETIKQAVLAGMGLAFLSIHTVARELREGTLVALDVAGFPFMRHWHLVTRRHKRLPPVAQAFAEYLVGEGAGRIAQDAALVPAAASPRRRAGAR